MSTIRWGVLGAASIARTRTLPAMHKAPSVELVALASRSMDKSAAACAELGIPTAYGSYDELLGRSGYRRRLHPAAQPAALRVGREGDGGR